MELVPMVLELPETRAIAEQVSQQRDRWTFTAQSRDSAMAGMAACGLTHVQLELLTAARWSETSAGCSVEPPDAVVLSLTPDVRAALYGRLTTDPANHSAINPAWFRDGKVDFRLRGSGLSESSVSLLKSLLYPSPDEPTTLLYNDIKPALRAIDDPAERQRFLKAVTRKRSFSVRLLVDDNADTAALAKYWGTQGREEALRPLLDALKYNAISGVERPAKINIVTLLPPFVQERLYRYADANLPAGQLADDCFWTAFNFFSDTPDDRVRDTAYLTYLLPRDYLPIAAPDQLGDVIILADENGNAIHAANFIADDIVFTKNGMNDRQPWILVPMKDLITQYRIKTPSLTIGYFRRR